MASPDLHPDHTAPKELAEHLGASKRAVGDKVRELGCYHELAPVSTGHLGIAMEA